MPRYRLVSLMLAGLGALALTASVVAQATERVAYVTALDAKTRTPVDALQPSDVRVTEDGRAREVIRVTPATSAMPVALLLDNQAGAQSTIADLRSSVTSFLSDIAGLGPVAVVTLADRPTIVQDYTTDPERLKNAVGRLYAQPGSGATLLDALQEISRGLERREEDRAAIVVVTTELTEFSTLHYSQVIDALRDAGAMMSAVVLLNPKGSIQDDPGRNRAVVLDRGVNETGGLRVDVLTSIGYAQALKQVSTALTHQHRVVYARPQTLIPPARVRFEAARQGLTLFGAPARGQEAR